MINVPTSADLKTRYAEFTTVNDARVTLFINEAARNVDETWTVDDQSPAIMALACHQMSLEGEPNLANGGGSAGSENSVDGRFLKERSVGDTKNVWEESSAQKQANGMSTTAAQAGYRSTKYGVTFLRLLKLNHTGMRAV